MPVDEYLESRYGQTVAGVYTVHNDDGQLQYIGYARSITAAIKVHMARSFVLRLFPHTSRNTLFVLNRTQDAQNSLETRPKFQGVWLLCWQGIQIPLKKPFKKAQTHYNVALTAIVVVRGKWPRVNRKTGCESTSEECFEGSLGITGSPYTGWRREVQRGADKGLPHACGCQPQRFVSKSGRMAKGHRDPAARQLYRPRSLGGE